MGFYGGGCCFICSGRWAPGAEAPRPAEVEGRKKGGQGSAASEPAGGEEEPTRQDDEAAGKRKAVKKAKAAPKQVGDSPQDRQASLLVKQAIKTKLNLLKARGAAEALCAQISSGHAEYRWANNAENVGLLEAAVKQLSEALSGFGKEWLIQDPRSVKELFPPAKLITELENLEQLGGKISEVSRLTTVLLNMHAKWRQ